MAAMGLGGILLAATILGVVTFDPITMVAGLAALLGGVVMFGSNTSTANQLSESMRNAEAMRAGLIDWARSSPGGRTPQSAGLRIDVRHNDRRNSETRPGACGRRQATAGEYLPSERLANWRAAETPVPAITR
jgi:hypothetical protein